MSPTGDSNRPQRSMLQHRTSCLTRESYQLAHCSKVSTSMLVRRCPVNFGHLHPILKRTTSNMPRAVLTAESMVLSGNSNHRMCERCVGCMNLDACTCASHQTRRCKSRPPNSLLTGKALLLDATQLNSIGHGSYVGTDVQSGCVSPTGDSNRPQRSMLQYRANLLPNMCWVVVSKGLLLISILSTALLIESEEHGALQRAHSVTCSLERQ